jgi:predicted transcriptional regulator
MSTAAQKRAYRRKILKGFPVPAVPMTLKQVREYYSHTKIQCLICGRLRNSLGNHLSIHKLTVEEYKEMYGLPWTVGLIGRRAFSNHSNAILSRMEEGYDASAKGERLHKMQQASKHQRIQPFGIELAKLNLPNEL